MEPMSVRRETWLAHVQAWRGSGITQSAYCQQHVLNPNRLAYWIKRERRPAADALTLVPLTVRPSASGESIALRHPSGWQLSLPSGVDPLWLAGLLRGMA